MSDNNKPNFDSQQLFRDLTGNQPKPKTQPSVPQPQGVNQPSGGMHVVSGLSLDYKPAPLGHRFVAICIDLGIITAVMYAVFLALIPVAAVLGIGGAAIAKEAAAIGMIVLGLAVLIVMMGGMHYYFIYFEEKKGATPGKKIMGLRVVSTKGGPITRRQAVIREIVRWYIDGLFGIPALIAIYSTDLKQRVGDLMAETMVVHSSASENEAQFLYVMQSDYNALLSALGKPEVEPHEAPYFLEFACNAFLTGSSPMIEYPPKYVDWARRKVPKATEMGVNDMTLLRFVAQYCHHLTRSQQ